MIHHTLVVALTAFLLPCCAGGQESGRMGSHNDPIDISKFDNGIRHWRNSQGKRIVYERFHPDQYREIADNLLRFQNPDGGWPKNIDWLGRLDRDVVLSRLTNFEKPSTFDNRNTYPQIEYLAQVFQRTGEEKYREAATRGLMFILSSQNASGGWRGADVDAITFNDDVMTGVMHLLLDIVQGKDYFSWVAADTRTSLEKALDRAVDVTLRCQIVVDGTKTGWCQQHDHQTLEPVKARRYELPSITAMETSGIVEFLMRLDPSRPGVTFAIQDAVAWLGKSALRGIRLERHPVGSRLEGEEADGRDDVLSVDDPDAPPVWARYYEIDTNRPFFANRDGIKVYSLADVEQERRIGYAWYGYWPEKILHEDYPRWLESRELKPQE